MSEASSTDLPAPPVATPPPTPPPGSTTGLFRRPVTGKALAGLAIGALGVVYGDIGTSPLYSLRECFHGPHAVPVTPENVLGVLSLVVWALVFVVAIKYLTLVMRADNRGAGGTFALLALVTGSGGDTGGIARRGLLLLAVFGASLLIGEGVITPAISVLGAVEGLSVAAPGLSRLVVPLSAGILVGLFFFQKRGTATVGAVFGPVMLVWFLVIFVLGIHGIAKDVTVLRALLPVYAVRFFVNNGWLGFFVLGGVVLVMTGCEALYADMGHFGKRPIRLAWWAVAMPALLVNYLGQGAHLLQYPSDAWNPFYLVAPDWAVVPLTGVATAAAVIASQALISGAFSLAHQAVQLGYCPRLTIRHTSHEEIGQIYVPEVNWAIGVGCLALVLGFRSSAALAAAYGIAVTGTMTVTTVLLHRVARDVWRWPARRAWALTLLLLSVDLSFFLANVVKISDGGWFPLAVGAAVFTWMTTWKRGRASLASMLRENALPIDAFMADLRQNDVQRVSGTAVFMSSSPEAVPPVLLHHLKHNKVLHERVVLVSIMSEEIPTVPEATRATTRDLGRGFFQVVARYGFMERPNVPELLHSLAARPPQAGPRLKLKDMETSYYLGRETLLPSGPARMATWRKRLFIFMARNAQTASSFFGLPANRVVEMGAQIQL